MSKMTWVNWVVAAVLVLIVGAVIAAAEERIEVRVEKDGNDEVTVDVNGVTQVVRLDDLAEGESRRFDVGDHELVITRNGDELTVISDGHSFGHHGKSAYKNVWVTDEGENIEISGDCLGGEKKMIVMKVAGDGDGEETYTIHVDGEDVLIDGDHEIDIEKIMESHGDGEHGAIFISKDGNVHHPGMITAHGMHGDMARFRCEETGSILLVKKDDAIEDTYICPATGCVMTRVEESEMHTVIIKKRIEIDEDDEH